MIWGSDAGVAPWRQRAAQRIDDARAAFDAGDLGTAVAAAEEALREADEAPPPGIVEVIEPARPLLTRVFDVRRPDSGMPMLAPRPTDRPPAAGGEPGRRCGGWTASAPGKACDGSGLGSTDTLPGDHFRSARAHEAAASSEPAPITVYTSRRPRDVMVRDA
jgi:hypothetical protein